MRLTAPTILLVTQSVLREPFLRDEMPLLSGLDAAVTLFPTDAESERPESLAGMRFDYSLARSRKEKLLHALGLGGPFFFEAAWRERAFTHVGKLARLAHVCASINFCHDRLLGFIERNALQRVPLLIYTYWFTPVTYAAWRLKRHFPHIRVLSRAHNIDVFPLRNPHGYLPLRSMRSNWPDILCPCSEAGARQFLADGADSSRINVQHLGVPEAPGTAEPSPPGVLTLVSCSSLQEVKRLPLLAASLRHLALSRPHVSIRWHHLGGGEGEAAFARLVAEQSRGVGNLDCTLHGQVSVEMVRAFYQSHPVDGLINVSSYEGVPVSMMEASSAGIPVLGTDVGGVADLVNSETGLLLPPDFSPEAFALAAERLMDFKDKRARERIRDFSARHFRAETNYRHFAANVLQPLIAASAADLRNE